MELTLDAAGRYKLVDSYADNAPTPIEPRVWGNVEALVETHFKICPGCGGGLRKSRENVPASLQAREKYFGANPTISTCQLTRISCGACRRVWVSLVRQPDAWSLLR